jgi:hypothetical protein
VGDKDGIDRASAAGNHDRLLAEGLQRDGAGAEVGAAAELTLRGVADIEYGQLLGFSPAGSHQLCLAHSFDYFVGAGEQHRRNGQTERFRGLQVE